MSNELWQLLWETWIRKTISPKTNRIWFSDYKGPLHNRFQTPKMLASYIIYARIGDWSAQTTIINHAENCGTRSPAKTTHRGTSSTGSAHSKSRRTFALCRTATLETCNWKAPQNCHALDLYSEGTAELSRSRFVLWRHRRIVTL